LDDKEDGEKDFVKNAPKISSFLSEKEISEFNDLENLLKVFGTNYKINDNLVRGLDYYTNTVFEIVDEQGVAIGGGGRYGKLVEEFGGSDVQCTGMAFGIDRIINYLDENKIDDGMDDTISIDVVFACIDKTAQIKTLKFLEECRKNGIKCICNFSLTKLDKVFNYAEKMNATYVFIVGENEIKNNTITCKNILTKVQTNDSLENLINKLKK
jgi:histidyl-tRNA synthetase